MNPFQCVYPNYVVSDLTSIVVTFFNDSPLCFLFSVCLYSKTSMVRTSLEPWKFIRDMDCSSH